MGIGVPWRRLARGGAVAACALAGASAPAAATLALSGASSVPIDSDAHEFHQGQQNMWSNGTYQFISSWDAADATTGEIYLQISRRRLSDNRVDTLRFDGRGTSPFAAVMTAPKDGHNGTALGVSPNDGRIHVSYSMHNSDRRNYYVYSDDACLSEATFSFSTCVFTRQFNQTSATARYAEDVNRGRRGSLLEDEMTYPNYFNDRRGRLYFSYRHDASSRGAQVLNRYDDSTHRWSYVGDVVNGEDGDYRFDPDGAGPSGTTTGRVRGVYTGGWLFDKRDRLHLTWVYKDGALIHGINYIYSDDYGVTWYSQAGTLLADLDETRPGYVYDPVTIADLAETQVISEPPGWHLANAFMNLDSNNNPHIVASDSSVQSDDSHDLNLRMAHFWRTTDGNRWQAAYIDPSQVGYGPIAGRVMVDRADNLHAIFGRNNLGWQAFNGEIYVQRDLPYQNVTWQSNGSGGGYLDLQVFSDRTFLDTLGYDIGVPVSTTGTNQLRVRMRNDTDSEDFFVTWRTDSEPTWSDNEQTFSRAVRARSGYTDYTFTITDADWRGNLEDLEIRPVQSSVTRGSQQIDWIRLTDSSGRVAKAWEFDEPNTLWAAEASQADNWATWTVEPLISGVQIPFNEGDWWFDLGRYRDAQVVSFPWLYQGGPGSERLEIREYRITGDTVIKDWRFDLDKMGWFDTNHISGFRWANDGGTKGVTGTITGIDSSIESMGNLDIAVGSNRYLHVRLKNSTASRLARIWFQSNGTGRWDRATRSTQFAIVANSGYTDYSIDMSGLTGWTSGTLDRVAFDPVDDGSTRSGTFNLDRIWIDNTR